MTVVECPECSSKFKINKDLKPRETVKMRCSVCSHVFTFSPAEEDITDKDFDLLIGTNDGELEEKPYQESTGATPEESFSLDVKEEISETHDEETQEEPDEKAKSDDADIEPESVIREIDSILGAGEEVASMGDEANTEIGSEERMPLKLKISLALVILLFMGIGLWFMRDSIPFFRGSHGGLSSPVLERGPFFSIPDDGVTYEILANNSEGSVLVMKGVIKKLSPKPLKSVMIEARVYDLNNNLMESRNAYAGIVPEAAELIRQKSADIDTLLTAEPRTLGVLETSQDIPFAVAFFGRPAREGSSFQVEVKEFHWK